jgi:hypothetical protein
MKCVYCKEEIEMFDDFSHYDIEDKGKSKRVTLHTYCIEIILEKALRPKKANQKT